MGDLDVLEIFKSRQQFAYEIFSGMSFRTQRSGTERSEKSVPFEAICPSTLKISPRASSK